METYRSGDVCERCQWQMKRAIRSGRGRNFYTAVLKKFRAPQQDITGLTRNIVGSVTTVSPKTLYSSAFTPCAFALSRNRISQFSRNLGIRLCLYNFIWRRIEVVITGLTRNQLGSNPPRVRISPSPPRTP